MAIALLAVSVAAAVRAQAVPLPMEKPQLPQTPGDAGEDTESAFSSSCLGELDDAGVIAVRAVGFAGSGECFIEAPVNLDAVETPNGRVSFPGRPTLECEFAMVLADWVRQVVNPVAASLLGSPVEEVLTGPGYQCRDRAQGRLSEHGLGNAVDISALRLVDGRSIPVERLPYAKGAEREFLDAMSASACGYFTTVLGPGSDAAHSDHLHVDRAERRTADYRICMAR